MDRKNLDVLIIGLQYLPEPTGIGPYTSGLAHGLAERGHQVRVIAGYPHYPWWKIPEGYRGLRRRETGNGVDLVRVRQYVPRNPVGLGRIGMEATFAAHAGLIRGRRPDVVLVMSPALLSVATALSWRRPGRTAVGVISQDLYSRALTETGALGGRGGGAAARLEGALLSRADGVAVIHDLFRETVVGLGVDPDKVTVIRNWTHISAPSGDRATARERLGWPEDEIIALHTGNMGHEQGLDNVVEAARLADSADLPIRFVLVGDGACRADLEALGSGVRRLQFVDLLPDGEFENALGAADVLVLNEKPGVTDMCVPGKLTSYFAAGRPVVAATDPRSGAASEVNAAEAGRCVRSGDPQKLLDAALALGRDREEAAAMGRRGREYAATVLSKEAAIDAYCAWIDRLTGGVAAHPAEPQCASQ